MTINVLTLLVGALFLAARSYSQNTHSGECQTVDSTFWIGTEINGYCPVSKNGFFAYSLNGELITEVKYERIFPFNEGMAIVCKENLYGVVDSTGKELVTPSFRFLADYSNGFSYGLTAGGEEALLNKKGENIFPGKNIRLRRLNGNYIRYDLGDYCLLNKELKEIYSINTFVFDKIISEKDNKWFLIDCWSIFQNNNVPEISEKRELKSKGVFMRSENFPTDLPFYFNDGLALVPQLVDNKVKFGFIDETGKQVIPFIFDNARYFVNGYACARKDSLWGVINKKGNWVIEPAYEQLENANGSYFIHSVHELQGVIDINKAVKIQPEYLKIDYLFDDLFAVLDSNEVTYRNAITYKNGFEPATGVPFWGCVEAKTGKAILPCNYNEIVNLRNHIGVGLTFEFIEHPTQESFYAIIHALNQAPHVNFSGRATATTFNVLGEIEKHKLENQWIEYRIFYPDYQDAQQFEIGRYIDDYLLVGGTFYDENGIILKDKARIDQLNSKTNTLKLVLTQDPTTKKVGATGSNNQQILPNKYDKIEVTNTGIIVNLNGLYGYYDLTGAQIIPLQYDYITEASTGVLRVQENERSGILMNKAGKEIIQH
ncbi:KWG Leptospira [compost metagenome]